MDKLIDIFNESTDNDTKRASSTSIWHCLGCKTNIKDEEFDQHVDEGKVSWFCCCLKAQFVCCNCYIKRKGIKYWTKKFGKSCIIHNGVTNESNLSMTRNPYHDIESKLIFQNDIAIPRGNKLLLSYQILVNDMINKGAQFDKLPSGVAGEILLHMMTEAIKQISE